METIRHFLHSDRKSTVDDGAGTGIVFYKEDEMHENLYKIENWLHGYGPRKIEYARGRNFEVAIAKATSYPSSDQTGIRKAAKLVHDAYKKGKCVLVQVRYGYDDYGYIAVRTRAAR